MKPKKSLIIFAGAMLMLCSCDVGDPIYETPHPEHGKITLTTDWTQIGAQITAPQNYTVKVGDYSSTVNGATNTINNLFAPGVYHANIYNTAEKITVVGTMATVASVTAPAGAQGAFVEPLPEWLFTSAMDVTIEKDKDHVFIAVMKQQLRELNLIIEPTGGTTEQIAGITATLSGVASSINIDNGTASGAASVAPVFTKLTSGADAGKYKATVRLLNITGSTQKLTVKLTYTGGNPTAQTIESDLSTVLTNFNTDKKTPLTLGSQVVETPTEAGFTATITDWVKVTGSGTAN